MCVIAYVPVNTQRPTTDTLTHCWHANAHGAGFMYPFEGALIVKKGYMTLVDFLAAWDTLPPNVPVIAHFRIRTHGLTSAALTHPFNVSPTVAIAHNGIFNISLPKDLKEDASDTSYFAHAVLAELAPGWHKNGAYKFLIEQYMGHGNKMVAMDNNGHVEIYCEDKGTWDEGVWFSNNSFRGYKPYVAPKTDYNRTFNYSSDYGEWVNGTWIPRNRTLTKFVDKDFGSAETDQLDEAERAYDLRRGSVPEPTQEELFKVITKTEKGKGRRPTWSEMQDAYEDGVLPMSVFVEAYAKNRICTPTKADRDSFAFKGFLKHVHEYYQNRGKINKDKNKEGARKTLHGNFPGNKPQ